MLFIMMVQLDQADLNCKNSLLTCRACVQLLLDVNGVDAIINIQMLKTLHGLLVHLAAFDNGRNPDIGTLKK